MLIFLSSRLGIDFYPSVFDFEEVPSLESNQMCALESHSVETTIKWFQFCVLVNLHFSSFHINDQLFSSHRA